MSTLTNSLVYYQSYQNSSENSFQNYTQKETKGRKLLNQSIKLKLKEQFMELRLFSLEKNKKL